MNMLVTIIFGLLFFAAIMACVALHEIGHMLPAKLFGIKVPKYFVGFGRTLWSIKKGDTEYGIKLFPLGGFVQLLGMYPPRKEGARDTKLQRFADDARAGEWEEITPADTGRLFYERSVPKKIVVMAGGITMNLLLAFILTWGVLGIHGAYRAQPVVSSVQQCIIETPREDKACRESDPRTPAAQAGLSKGDRIVEFNGTAITTYAQLSALIRANENGEARMVVERDGVRTELTPTRTRISYVADTIDPSKRVKAGWLGISPRVERQLGGPADAISDLSTQAVQSIVALVQLPIKTFNVVADMVTGKPRSVYSPMSVVGASVVAGEVAAVDAPVADRAAMFVSLLASINLFLAMFNLVPLPPLDGGHIVGALYEGVRRRIAKVRGRPDPGPADTAKLLPIAYVVGGLLLLLGIALILADIISPVRIF